MSQSHPHGNDENCVQTDEERRRRRGREDEEREKMRRRARVEKRRREARRRNGGRRDKRTEKKRRSRCNTIQDTLVHHSNLTGSGGRHDDKEHDSVTVDVPLLLLIGA